jgi:hypothetical protein
MVVVTWAGGDVMLSKEDHLEIALFLLLRVSRSYQSVPNQFLRPGRIGRRRHTTVAGGVDILKRQCGRFGGWLLIT